jgi:ribonuclease R
VYFPRRVIPMLPEKLSNGLCSLNPEVERLAWSATWSWTAKGGRGLPVLPGGDPLACALTYTEVAAVLANTRGPEAQRRADLVPHLLHLHEVYRACSSSARRRGAVDFETTETQIVCDDNGRIEKIVPRTRNEAHRLIEEAMLAANVCAADFIAGAKHPALYRVHEGPTPEKRLALQNYLQGAGLGLHLSDEPKPAECRPSPQATKDRPDAPADPHDAAALDAAGHLHGHQRRPLRPGLRRLHPLHQPDPPLPGPAGAPRHQGAAGRRRYHLMASDRTPEPPAAQGRQARGGRSAKPLSQELELWEAAGCHCSANERRADEASRDVEAWLKCRYMREHLGEEFAGTVSAVAPASASSSRWMRCTSRAWCTSPNSAASTTASTNAAGTARRAHRRALWRGLSRVRVQVSRVDLSRVYRRATMCSISSAARMA